MTEQERLMRRLFDDPKVQTLNVSITRGAESVSMEDICREMNRAFDQVQSGTARRVTNVDF